MKQNNTDKSNIDIIDFELDEFDEEFEKEEKKKQIKKQKKEEAMAARSKKNNEEEEANENDASTPNRDMLKTIVMILLAIMIACFALGFITLLAKNIGNESNSKTKKTEATTEEDWKDKWKPNADSPDNSTEIEDDQKKKFEESIEDITNKVNHSDSDDDDNNNKKKKDKKKKTESSDSDASETNKKEDNAEDLPPVPSDIENEEWSTDTPPDHIIDDSSYTDDDTPEPDSEPEPTQDEIIPSEPLE